MWLIKVFLLIIIFLITLTAGFYPFFKKATSKYGHDFPVGESLATGVFLGAALIHLLGDASDTFYQLGFTYPIAFCLAGSTFLFFLLLEHVAREIHQHRSSQNTFAIVAILLLSIHSFLAGCALGTSQSLSLTLIIFLAILAHKWAAGFALAVQINKADFNPKIAIGLFLGFAIMTPLGIIFGTVSLDYLATRPLLTPTFAALAGGTFLYLGTLHGLERSVLIKQCCNLKNFLWVILGFVIMAIAAIWV